MESDGGFETVVDASSEPKAYLKKYKKADFQRHCDIALLELKQCCFD